MTEHSNTGQTATGQDPESGSPSGLQPAGASQPSVHTPGAEVPPAEERQAAGASLPSVHTPGAEVPPAEERQAAGAPPAGAPLAHPSPYLSPSETVPHAYLAPPQPDQPGYGSPSVPGQRAFGSGRQLTGRPGPGQPRLRARAARRPQAGRDPVLATPGERLVACLVDWTIIVTASLVVFLSPLLRLVREFQAVATHYPNLSTPAAKAAADAIARDPANLRVLLYWFLGMFGIALVYYWVQHALWGMTVGKRALSIRVVTAADRSGIGVWMAGLRAIAFLAGPAVFLLLASPVNVIGGLLWLADTLTPLVDSRAQCLHDKLTGTVVISQRRSRNQARSPASPW